jgi:hypothetical protein
MRTGIFIALLFSLSIVAGHAQETKIDTAVYSFFNKLPGLSATIEETYKTYAPSINNTACQQFRIEIKKQLALLAQQSYHKSRLLSMLAGKFDDESQRIDFSKTTIARDKTVQAAIDKANTSFFSSMDDYTRSVNNKMDSAYKQSKGMELAKQQLEIYRTALPSLINTVKKSMAGIQKLLDDKGYNKQLIEQNTAHPYYIQLLEVRGLFFDRLLKLTEQIEGIQRSVASQVDICKKSPELCK